MQLVNNLTSQIDGVLKMENGKGTEFRIDFGKKHNQIDSKNNSVMKII